MENAVMVARVLGPVMLVPALGMVINQRPYQRMALQFADSPALLYLGGFVALVCGLVVLQFQHAWRPDWTLIITLLGWLMVVKGAVLLLVPGVISGLARAWAKVGSWVVLQALATLAIGAWLCYRGYLA